MIKKEHRDKYLSLFKDKCNIYGIDYAKYDMRLCKSEECIIIEVTPNTVCGYNYECFIDGCKDMVNNISRIFPEEMIKYQRNKKINELLND